MLHRFALLAVVLIGNSILNSGCRSCSSCEDYGPPVANCESGACGCGRAGSASGSYAGHGGHEGYVEGEVMEEGVMEDGVMERSEMPQESMGQ